MLFPYHTRYVTNPPSALHLGDLVNIYQRSLGSVLYSETVCPCCGNSAGEVFRFLCSLNTVSKFGKIEGTPEEVKPWWFKGESGEKVTYVKAAKLPPKGNHVAVQIDTRSKGKKVPPWAEKIVKCLNGAVNVGDRPLKCRDATKESLANKFEIIASSRYYVGVDSGLSHLALTTNVPIILIHPPEWNLSRFYPQTPQIQSVTSYEGFRNVTQWLPVVKGR